MTVYTSSMPSMSSDLRTTQLTSCLPGRLLKNKRKKVFIKLTLKTKTKFKPCYDRNVCLSKLET